MPNNQQKKTVLRAYQEYLVQLLTDFYLFSIINLTNITTLNTKNNIRIKHIYHMVNTSDILHTSSYTHSPIHQ